MIPTIKLNDKEVKFERRDPPKPGAVVDKKTNEKEESKEYGVKSHHEFLKTSQENKNPVGKMIEKKNYNMEEVSKHNKQSDIWMVLKGKIYDVTRYMDYHPGGRKKLMEAAGADGTTLFMSYHPWVNLSFILEKYYIGDLKKY